MPEYLFWCANELSSFRLAEFDSLISLLGVRARFVERHVDLPYVILDVEEEREVLKVLERSTATKTCIRLWARGKNERESLHKELRNFCDQESNREELRRHEMLSFKMHVESFNKKLSAQEKLSLMNSFSYLPLKGRVSLSEPQLVVSIFEFFGLDQNKAGLEPELSFIGRLVGHGQRELLQTMSLKGRKYIGNTTMDPQLSLLMCNIGQVNKNELVLDPFAGTGSILLAAAHFGAYCWAADIDYQVMHARSKSSRHDKRLRDEDEGLKANFEQLNLAHRFVDNLVCDNSKTCFRANKAFFFDLIITDPPYGLREPQERVGTTRSDPSIPLQHLNAHFPQKVMYDLSTLYRDLLGLASTRLSVGGRLCFWLPVNRESYDLSHVPINANFEVLANCEQVLSSHTSRRFIVLRKVRSSSSQWLGQVHHFLKGAHRAQKISRKERKERLRKFGHLNLLLKQDPS